MAEKFKSGDAVKVRLSRKHTTDGELVEHAAKLLRIHPDGEWADVELERHHSIDEGSGQKINRLSVPLAQVIAALLLLFLFVSPAPAQDLGNVGLRTINAVLANTVTCTGTPQNFSTTNVALQNAGFRNLGQTSHTATATSNASAFQMEIDGIDSLNNVFRISDLQLGVPSTAKGGIVVTASGNMTNIQVSVTCTAAATFSVSYMGSFSPYPPNFAGALLNALDKLPFQTSAANTNASVTFQTPTGNSSGTIIFQYAAAGPSGSTITAQCLTNNGTNLQAYVFSPTTVSTAQLFSVSASTCPFVTLSYTSGGASATTYNLEYVFTSTGTTNAIVDPCLSPSVMKQSLPVPLTNAATTVQIIPLTAGQTIYPCGLSLTATWGATNFTYTWEYGTGAACGTGTTALSGAKPIVNANITTESWSGATFFSIPAGNALCLVMSAATGGTGGIAGWISFVKQ